MPVAGVRVEAFDKDLRHEQKLGDAVTGKDGRYEIRYSRRQFRRAEKERADLIVRAYDREKTLLAESGVLFNAQPQETVDLVVGGEALRGPSEYERLLAAVKPLLGDLSLADLTEDEEHQDLSFLAGETGEDRGLLELLIAAHRLGAETQLEAEVFYGFFRQGLPLELRALLVQSDAVLRRAVVRAAEANTIPPAFAERADDVLDRIHALRVRQALDPPAAEDGGASLNDLLSVTFEDGKLRQKLLDALLRRRGWTAELWQELAAEPELKAHVAELQHTLKLGALSGNHLPLVRALRQMEQAGEIGELADLARFDARGWHELLVGGRGDGAIGAPPGVSGEGDEKLHNYAEVLSDVVEDAFPTAFVRHRLEEDEALPGHDDLATFLRTNPDYDLRASRLPSHLVEHPAALAGVRDAGTTEKRLRALQRIYKLAPRYRQASALLKAGLDSAHAVARLGRNRFIAKLGNPVGDRKQLRGVYARAQRAVSISTELAFDFGIGSYRTSPEVVRDRAVPEVEGIPEWSTLFGSIELCGCQHCRSVLSPAAYLVDVLHFLADRPSTTAGRSAKDVLFDRRPDLGEIELTCENTNLPLPYVDLVNEALENAVAPPVPGFAPFTLPSPPGADLEADLNARTLSPELRAAFDPPLSENAVITVGGEGKPWEVDPDWWTIDEPGYSYTVRREDGTLRVVARGLQTKGSTAERAANPQYVNAAAYGALGRAVFPWSMPFELWSEEARAYLDHLGVPRLRVMESLHPGDRRAVLNDPQVAAECLGLTRSQADLITGAVDRDADAATPGPWNLWGFADSHLSHGHPIPDPSDRTRPITSGGWIEVLGGRLDVFLQQSGLSYRELLDLLGSYWVNPLVEVEGGRRRRAIRIVSRDAEHPDSCETDRLALEGLGPAEALRCVRFVRLWRACRDLGWSLRDLDRAFTALAPSELRTFLVQLSHVERLHRALDVPVASLLTWWAEIDTAYYVDHGAPGQPRVASLYDRLFLDRTTVNPPDPAFTDPAALTGTFAGHEATLTAALGLGADDLALLLDHLSLAPTAALSLENLSLLYRHAALARVLGLPLGDSLALGALLGVDPFAGTADAVLFVETVERVRDAGFSVAELDSLLRCVGRPESPVAPAEETVAGVLAELRAGLQAIAAENTFRDPEADPGGATVDLDGELTRRKLSQLGWDAAWIDRTVAALNAESCEADVVGRLLRTAAVPELGVPLAALPEGLAVPRALGSKVYFDPTRETLRCRGVMTETERAALLELSTRDPANEDDPGHLAYRAAVEELYDQAASLEATLLSDDDVAALSAAPAPEDRFRLVLERLLPQLRAALGERFVGQTMAEALLVDASVADLLLRRLTDASSGAPRSCLAVLCDPAFAASHVDVELTPGAFPAQFAAFLRLHKAALIAVRFGLGNRLLDWLFRRGPEAGWLDLSALPTAAGEPAADFDGWLRLAELARLRDVLPQGESALDELLALAAAVPPDAAAAARAEAKGAWLAALGRWTGWTPSDVEYLVGGAGDPGPAGRFAVAFPAGYAGVGLLARLHAAFAVLERLELPAPLAAGLTVEIGPSTARDVRQAVRAKYDEQQWLTLAKPLRDVLRERQRAALVAYLVRRAALPDPVRDATDLYAHFLIDVEMQPCMMTSRIKQALSSIQLFVQRCFMGLEPEVEASAEVDDRWLEWKWMRQYRVWEANRRIFLYPENWILPELRDDKSPFFVELESELLQSDLTRESAEEAFRNYLAKLDQVAQLEVVAVCHQLETDSAGQETDVLHVFARTTGMFHTYFYRRRVDSWEWTPWERIDVDIEGESLIPAVWNRRLYLFWPILTEQAREYRVEMPAGGGSFDRPEKYWEIQLAWSERRQGGWTPKNVSADPLVFERRYEGTGYAWILDQSGQLTSPWLEWADRSVDLREPADFVFSTHVDADNRLFIFAQPRAFVASGLFIIESPNAFRFDACNLEPRRSWFLNSVRPSVTATIQEGMFLKETGFGNQLFLPAPITDAPALGKTPGSFLLVPHADGARLSQHPFFYRDGSRTFFVSPFWEEQREPAETANDAGVGQLMNAASRRWRELVERASEAVGPRVEPGDPLPFTPPDAGAAEEAVWIASGNLPPSAAVSPVAYGGSRGARNVTHRSLPVAHGALFDVHVVPARIQRYRFATFYHPYASVFVRQLHGGGIDALLQRRLQLYPYADEFALRGPGGGRHEPLDFPTEYEPYEIISGSDPQEDVDFGDGAYALYNWELFFHAPLLIADRLRQNGRHEEAQRWFHAIFDPTDSSRGGVPQRFWRTKPFYRRTTDDYDRQRIQNLLTLLAAGGDEERRSRLSDEEKSDLEHFEKTVDRWRRDPFKPHLIARLRTTAYQKTVVMKYLDNLIAWGDRLFRRDTIESINEATQLFVLAAEILGRRPQDVPPRATPRVQTYNTLEPSLGALANALVEIEELVSASALDVAPSATEGPSLTLPAMLYFCVPKNDKLLAYWDTVGDRLFKIRHCMNIEGVVRLLPLFAPPIEPGLLVKAAAAGVDVGGALDLAGGALPGYRFQVVAQKAGELCAELKSLGQAMLGALEKRDAEELALLGAGHETALLELVEKVRTQQVSEAEEEREALVKSREAAESRYLHYQRLLGKETDRETLAAQETIAEDDPSEHVTMQEEEGIKLIQHEKDELSSLQQSHEKESSASSYDFAANIVHLAVPDGNVSPFGVGISFGGSNVGAALSAAANRYRADSADEAYNASRNARLAQYVLRGHDWLLQSNQAGREILQLRQQIVAADLRREIAAKELANHRQQVEQARQVEETLRAKYTHQELYGWMIGQLSTVYFQTYQLAYDLAKRAERAYRFELGLQDSDFIRFGYWDSLKKGLMAGERLLHDLQRMEVAYLENHRREYELTKHVSVRRLDPLALIRLRQTGRCNVSLPEALFDLDFPGHTLRRLKSVAVSVPCVSGPYTGIPCTLTLLRSSVRRGNTLLEGRYARQVGDPRFTDSVGAIQSIATSSGQNDSGLFETNLGDGRYLPFEGAGAISEWQIELPEDFRPLDYDTISDVILHLRYTAREGGGRLAEQAGEELGTALDAYPRSDGQQGLAQLLSLRHELPSEWHRFFNPPPGQSGDATLTMALTEERLPFFVRGKTSAIDSLELLVKVAPEHLEGCNASTLKLSLSPGDAATDSPWELADAAELKLLRASRTSLAGGLGNWTLTGWLSAGDGGHQRLDPGAIQDVFLVCHYLMEGR